MRPSLSYGRVTWGFEEDQHRPVPVFTFTPVRYQGRPRYPRISDRDGLTLLKLSGKRKISFRDAYIQAICRDPREASEIGEGRSLIRWLKKRDYVIVWKKNDFTLHSFLEGGPGFDPADELSKDHCFSILPVTVLGRLIKLYIEDDAVLALLSLDYGEEEDFLSLVRRYIARRIQWEHWRAPAPTFLDWVRVQGKRPVFRAGQLGFKACLASQEDGGSSS